MDVWDVVFALCVLCAVAFVLIAWLAVRDLCVSRRLARLERIVGVGTSALPNGVDIPHGTVGPVMIRLNNLEGNLYRLAQETAPAWWDSGIRTKPE